MGCLVSCDAQWVGDRHLVLRRAPYWTTMAKLPSLLLLCCLAVRTQASGIFIYMYFEALLKTVAWI